MNSGQDILQSMIEKHKIISKSPEDTFALGKQIGESVAPGSVLTLVGDLGVGKTVFTQGLAAGLGISDAVNSPTFTIVQEYETGRIPLYHFDVYRLADPEELEEIGYEEYFFGEGVCLIEWPSRIEELIPECQDGMHSNIGTIGASLGFALMMVLDVALG